MARCFILLGYLCPLVVVMSKWFNTACPCKRYIHYMLSATERLPEIKQLIAQENYGNVSHLLEGVVTWVRISRKKRWYLKQSNVQPAEV